ncbi:peptidase [Magnetofaba australis]|uniref:Putative 20S proteasome n=1 Tax=Magnetofaba australis IT-1 TaxID=1434232 RepID=A0A1Y2K4G8_9PROT|nr:peptidase [Magnetofaba australis]OSM02024.1 putative 20S proteasome [Magnetofaba australis IT-1]
MTYCVGILLKEGMVLASDSRTNAGVDQVGIYPKMHLFAWEGERHFAVLAAGNLATTQAVVAQLASDGENEEIETNLRTVASLTDAADYLGEISRAVQKRYAGDGDKSVFQATFMLAGQIQGEPMGMHLIYPEGNHIEPSPYQPYLQIGETKYGKPILDRIVTSNMSLENAARTALVSHDSTMRSNLSVGPPIDLLIYRRNQIDGGKHIRMQQNTPYLASLRKQWQKGMERIFHRLPLFDWEKNANG